MKPNKHPYKGNKYNRQTLIVFVTFLVIATMMAFVAWYLDN